MKTIALILTSAAFLAAATEPGQTPAEKPKTLAQQRADAAAARARQAKIPQTATPAGPQKGSQPAIPADAVEVGPNLYRHQDAQGKTWFYSRTPFGVSQWQDGPSSATSAAPSATAKQDAPLITTDLGDRVQFERKSPFGSEKWIRKKSELTEEEKAAVSATPQAPGQSQNKAAEKQ